MENQQPIHEQQPVQPQVNRSPGEGNAIASLVLGICAFMFVGLGLILSIIGLFLGKQAKQELGENSMATAGVIINSIVLCIYGIPLIGGLLFLLWLALVAAISLIGGLFSTM